MTTCHTCAGLGTVRVPRVAFGEVPLCPQCRGWGTLDEPAQELRWAEQIDYERNAERTQRMLLEYDQGTLSEYVRELDARGDTP